MLTFRPGIAAAALAFALASAGCGSQAGSPERQADGSGTSTGSGTTTAQSTSSSEATRSATEPTTTRQDEVKQASFSSPTRNIWCVVSDSDARCDVAERDWSVSEPANCDFDYGYGATVVEEDRPAVVENGREIIPAESASRGSLLCGSDTLIGNGSPLGYGESRRASPNGKVVCESRRDGVTCRNSRGHGFTVSKQRYVLF